MLIAPKLRNKNEWHLQDTLPFGDLLLHRFIWYTLNMKGGCDSMFLYSILNIAVLSEKDMSFVCPYSDWRKKIFQNIRDEDIYNVYSKHVSFETRILLRDVLILLIDRCFFMNIYLEWNIFRIFGEIHIACIWMNKKDPFFILPVFMMTRGCL